MPIVFSPKGIQMKKRSENKKIRKYKGRSLLAFPKDYVIVDIETTDFDAFYGEIIEICAKKYIQHQFHSEFKTLIKAKHPLNDKTIQVTGIDDEMLQDKPFFEDIADDFMDFIEDSILIAHNAHFDINFLYDYLLQSNHILDNDFVDTLRLSRILIKDTPNHQLKTLCQHFDLHMPSHRSEADVLACKDLYDKLREIHENNPSIFEAFLNRRKKRSTNRKRKSSKIDYSEIQATVDLENIDTTNPFFKKHVCFTGKMEFLTKKEGAQIIANLGGNTQANVTKKTDYLILGDLNHQKRTYGAKSKKHQKAEKLQKEGHDITILSEITFLEMVDEEIFD